METKIYHMNPKCMDIDLLKEAADIIRDGGTVAFPTETVYGLGANALDEKAVKKIFKAKGRPSDNPLIVHISNIEELKGLVKEVPDHAKKLMEKFWPGPLTIILKKTNKIPMAITAGLDTVAIRMPSHPIAHKLIELAKVPIAAPSANLSGKPSPTKAEHVLYDLSKRVEAIICGGSCEVGVESTVVEVIQKGVTILRPGGVTKEDLEKVVDHVEMDHAIEIGGEDLIPKAPGMKYTHYSPKADVTIITGSLEEVQRKIQSLCDDENKQGRKVGVLCTDETKDFYENGVVLSMGTRKDVATIASHLFDMLRKFDDQNVDVIYAESVEAKNMGHAVMNRMIKAAGHKIIHVGR